MKFLDYTGLVSIGIEPARAETMSCPGEVSIGIEGDNVYIDMDYDQPIATAEFVALTNSQPFDYESGCWIN